MILILMKMEFQIVLMSAIGIQTKLSKVYAAAVLQTLIRMAMEHMIATMNVQTILIK